MSSIVISGDTSGAITLAAPSVAGTNTATLPAAAGTVMVSGNMPAFSAYSNTNQTGLTSSTYVKAAFNTKVFDTNSYYDATTNYRFTPLVAGYYQVNASYFATGTGFNGQANIYKNGSIFYGSSYANSTGISSIIVNVSGIVYMNGSTDYLEGYIYGSTTAGTWTITNSQNYTYFNAVLVRAA
jgi:hypothetical protein